MSDNDQAAYPSHRFLLLLNSWRHSMRVGFFPLCLRPKIWQGLASCPLFNVLLFSKGSDLRMKVEENRKICTCWCIGWCAGHCYPQCEETEGLSPCSPPVVAATAAAAARCCCCCPHPYCWVGLNDVHLFFRCELGKMDAKETEVGYKASRDDEDDGGHTSRDDDIRKRSPSSGCL